MTSTPHWNDTSARFYEAEERWREDWINCELGDDVDRLTQEEAAAFVADVLARSDFGTEDRPSIVWDVPDDSELSGRYDPADDALHLHPRIIRKSLVLHELAHWIDPRPRDGQGHGSAFLETFTTLIGPAFGEDAAAALRACVDEVAE